MQSRFVDVSGARLFVREWGDGEAAVLYWDGLGGCGLHANEIAPILSDRFGLRVIALDPPGHGLSAEVPLAAYRPSLLAELAAGLLDALGLGRVAFVGLSWGARVACSFGAQFPERTTGVVLLDGGYLEWRDLPGIDAGASLEACIADVEPESYSGWDEYVGAERDRRRRWTPALEESHRAMMRDMDDAIVPILGRDARGAIRYWGYQEPVTETYPRIVGLPVLLLVAPAPSEYRAEAKRAVARFRAALPRATVRTMQGGHDLVSDAAPELAATVGEWLAQ